MQDTTALMIACIPRLRRYARALIGDRAGADDLVQDTMEQGCNKLSTWRRGSDMRAWLFAIMHNLYVNQVRKPALQTETFDDDTPHPFINDPHADRLGLRDMQTALGLLPAEQREVLLLVALEEMSYEEVAATLRIPTGTVMSRLARARQRLRALMEGRPAEGRPAVSSLKVVK